VVSNQIPKEMSELTNAALKNDWEKARRIHRKYLPLMQGNFIESSPMPLKAVMAMMGKIEEVYRLPLVPVKPETRTRLRQIATEVGLLKSSSAVSDI
jgi:4-hydroxy-tetrahydrodipicolinate synthase